MPRLSPERSLPLVNYLGCCCFWIGSIGPSFATRKTSEMTTERRCSESCFETACFSRHDFRSCDLRNGCGRCVRLSSDGCNRDYCLVCCAPSGSAARSRSGERACSRSDDCRFRSSEEACMCVADRRRRNATSGCLRSFVYPGPNRYRHQTASSSEYSSRFATARNECDRNHASMCRRCFGCDRRPGRRHALSPSLSCLV